MEVLDLALDSSQSSTLAVGAKFCHAVNITDRLDYSQSSRMKWSFVPPVPSKQEHLARDTKPQRCCRFGTLREHQLSCNRWPAVVAHTALFVDAVGTGCQAGHDKWPDPRSLFVKNDEEVWCVAPKPRSGNRKWHNEI
jgi:hypothetical protein